MTKWLAPLLLTGSLTYQYARDTRTGFELRPEPTTVLFASYPVGGPVSLSAAAIYNVNSRLALWNVAVTFALKRPR